MAKFGDDAARSVADHWRPIFADAEVREDAFDEWRPYIPPPPSVSSWSLRGTSIERRMRAPGPDGVTYLAWAVERPLQPLGCGWARGGAT